MACTQGDALCVHALHLQHQHNPCGVYPLPPQNLFLDAVAPGVLPDYEAWVPQERQMWLKRIGERVSSLR
jgi:hypothetical protein